MPYLTFPVNGRVFITSSMLLGFTARSTGKLKRIGAGKTNPSKQVVQFGEVGKINIHAQRSLGNVCEVGHSLKNCTFDPSGSTRII